MNRISIFLLIFKLLLPLTASLSAQTADLSLTAEIDKLFQEHYNAAGPGATVMVSQKGQVLYQKAFGMANT